MGLAVRLDDNVSTEGSPATNSRRSLRRDVLFPEITLS
jgi:hypothetical protein